MKNEYYTEYIPEGVARIIGKPNPIGREWMANAGQSKSTLGESIKNHLMRDLKQLFYGVLWFLGFVAIVCFFGMIESNKQANNSGGNLIYIEQDASGRTTYNGREHWSPWRGAH